MSMEMKTGKITTSRSTSRTPSSITVSVTLTDTPTVKPETKTIPVQEFTTVPEYTFEYSQQELRNWHDFGSKDEMTINESLTIAAMKKAKNDATITLDNDITSRHPIPSNERKWELKSLTTHFPDE